MCFHICTVLIILLQSVKIQPIPQAEPQASSSAGWLAELLSWLFWLCCICFLLMMLLVQWLEHISTSLMQDSQPYQSESLKLLQCLGASFLYLIILYYLFIYLLLITSTLLFSISLFKRRCSKGRSEHWNPWLLK